jgi:hypothetical protein
MPPEPDHRLLSPFRKKRFGQETSEKNLFVVHDRKLTGDGQDKRWRSDQECENLIFYGRASRSSVILETGYAHIPCFFLIMWRFQYGIWS